MKTFLRSLVVAAAASVALTVSAQSYSIDWYKVAGGGGSSTSAVYSISGTIGQHDAGGTLSGGGYSVTGGFWSLINVIQTPGLANLLIVQPGDNSVKLLWPDPAGNTYTLQQNANLSVANGWVTSGFSITNGFGTNYCTITPPVGNLFFRLKQ